MFSTEMDLDLSTKQAISKIIERIEKIGLMSGKKPSTIASVAIYMACVISDDEERHECGDFLKISEITKISAMTIKESFKRYVFPKRMEIAPMGYGDSIEFNPELG